MGRFPLQLRSEPLDPSMGTAEHVAVGYDGMMQTFFGTVLGAGDDVLLDVGDLWNKIRDPAEVLDAVRNWAHIPQGMEEELMMDAVSQLSDAEQVVLEITPALANPFDEAVSHERGSHDDEPPDDARHDSTSGLGY